MPPEMLAQHVVAREGTAVPPEICHRNLFVWYFAYLRLPDSFASGVGKVTHPNIGLALVIQTLGWRW